MQAHSASLGNVIVVVQSTDCVARHGSLFTFACRFSLLLPYILLPGVQQKYITQHEHCSMGVQQKYITLCSNLQGSQRHTHTHTKVSVRFFFLFFFGFDQWAATPRGKFFFYDRLWFRWVGPRGLETKGDVFLLYTHGAMFVPGDVFLLYTHGAMFVSGDVFLLYTREHVRFVGCSSGNVAEMIRKKNFFFSVPTMMTAAAAAAAAAENVRVA
jgi:hypothetical protein